MSPMTFLDPPALAWVLLSYGLGSFPTAYLLVRWLTGQDIRRMGSGNPGATNVFRSVGKGAGAVTLAVDALKGWLPVWLCLRFFPGDWTAVLTGLATVAGHTWSPFLRFRGGKGVATSAGVFLALLPWTTLAALGVFALTLAASRHVSAGSLAAALILPPLAYWRHGLSPRAGLAAVVGLLVIMKHIPNIRRLMRGEEHAVSFSNPKKEEP